MSDTESFDDLSEDCSESKEATPEMANGTSTNKRTLTEILTEEQPPSKQTCESGSHSSTTMDQKDEEHSGDGACGNNEIQPNETSDINQGDNKVQKEGNTNADEQISVPCPGPIQFTSVQQDSISLAWGPPERWTGHQKFTVTWKSEGTKHQEKVTSSNLLCINNLLYGEKYEFKVATLDTDNRQSEFVSATALTEIPEPQKLDVKMDGNSALVTWEMPERQDQAECVLSLWKKPNESDKEECLLTIKTSSEEYTLNNLELIESITYVIRVCTVLKNGSQGKPTTYYIQRADPVPEHLTVTNVTPASIHLTWSPPQGMTQIQHSYQISYNSGGTESEPICADECSAIITDLQPCTKYNVSVRTKLNNGRMSAPAETGVETAVPVPEQLTVTKVTPASIHLAWSQPQGMTQIQPSYQISYNSGGTESEPICADGCSTIITDLQPCTKYNVSVRTKLNDGRISAPAKTGVQTAVPVPEHLTVTEVTPASICLTWSPPQGMTQIQHQSSYNSGGTESEPICTEPHVTIIKAVPAPQQFPRGPVTPTSVTFTSRPPQGMTQIQHSYQISYSSGETESKTICSDECSTVITDLQPFTKYKVSVRTKLNDGRMSAPAETGVETAVPPPSKLTVVSKKPTSAEVTWTPPHELKKIPHSYEISYDRGEPKSESDLIYADECSTIITDLQPYTEYNVSVRTKLNDGRLSAAFKKPVCTAIPPPLKITVGPVTPTSAELTWSPPQGMDQTLLSYQISYRTKGTESKPICTNSCSSIITGLQPWTKYTVSVCTKVMDEGMSEPVEKEVCTALPPPLKITVGPVTPTSARLTWSPPQGMGQTLLSYQTSYRSQGTESKTICTNSCSSTITGLQPCTKYTVSVCTKIKDEGMSEPVEKEVCTAVPVPGQPKVDSRTATSVELTWSPPQGMEKIPYSYHISYSIRSLGIREPVSESIQTDLCRAVITDLQPDTKYNVRIYIKLGDDRVMKEAAKAEFHTEILTKKFYTIVIGNTQNHHKPLMDRLMRNGVREANQMEDCDLILAFCVIVSRVGTDMEAALKQIPDSKPVILTVMHHTFDPDHVTPDTSRFARGRKITVVDILFHEDKGILRCQRNMEAEQKIIKFILECPESKRSTSLFGSSTKRTIPPAPQVQLPPATRHEETDTVSNTPASDSVRGRNPGTGYRNGLEEHTKKSNSSSASSKEVTYCVVLTGNTLGSHKDFQKRLAERVVLPNEVKQSSVAECSFLMVFCPVVCSVGVDIEKALKHTPDDKLSILVVMHHTFNPDFLPPESRGYSRNSNILIVDCLFYEDTGILRCQRNDEAFDKISKWIIGKFPNLNKSCQSMSWPSATGGWRMPSMPSMPSISWGFNRK